MVTHSHKTTKKFNVVVSQSCQNVKSSDNFVVSHCIQTTKSSTGSVVFRVFDNSK